MSETLLRDALQRHLDDIEVPPGDVFASISAGRRRHRRRVSAAAAGATLALALVAGTGVALMTSEGSSTAPDTSGYAELGALDFSEGARAYADPGGKIHLGGRAFPAKDLAYLDTDAVATNHGVVFFDDGRPMLLGSDGKVVALVDGELDRPNGFHPTAKADSVHPWVAWATRSGGETTLTVYDLEAGEEVASAVAPCGRCDDLVIDALDDGVAYVRVGEETQAWSSDTGRWQLFAGRGSEIADVRGGVVLYDGKPPSQSRNEQGFVGNEVPGPIDAQLTFDGRYILSWSSTLSPTLSGQSPVVLEQGPVDPEGGLAFYNVDSDGSILVATVNGSYPDFTVYDCEVPSGACEELGPLRTTGGDPMFIGNDM
jgi:hypothetical protein